MTNNINLVVPDGTTEDINEAYSQVSIGSDATVNSTVQDLTNFVFQGNHGKLVTPPGRLITQFIPSGPTIDPNQDYYAGPITQFKTGDIIDIQVPELIPLNPLYHFDGFEYKYDSSTEQLQAKLYSEYYHEYRTYSITISEQIIGQYDYTVMDSKKGGAASGLFASTLSTGQGQLIRVSTGSNAPTLSVSIGSMRAQSTVTTGPGIERVTAAGITQNLLPGQSMQFQDGTLSFDRAAFEPQNTNLPIIFQFYQTALGRAPDALGENVWNGDINQGLTMIGLASALLNSGEHQAVFGTQSDVQFVTQLYETGLGHAPGQAGYDYWLGQLSGGASRDQVLFGISQSQESINYNAGVMSAGVFKSV